MGERAAGSAASSSIDLGGGRRHDRAARGADCRDGAVIRVLVVDDHAVVREGLRDVPRARRRASRSSARPATASRRVAEAERLAPDVVLMDLVMPRLDGVGRCREIRARARRDAGARADELRRRRQVLPAVRAGAAGYLLKDAEPSELVRGDPGRARRRGAARPEGARRGCSRRSNAPPGGASRSPRASSRCSRCVAAA